MKIYIIGRGGEKKSIDIPKEEYHHFYEYKYNEHFTKDRYINLRDLTWRFQLDMNIKIPVFLEPIIEKNGWKLVAYKEIKNQKLKEYSKGKEAFTTCDDFENYIIYYNDKLNYRVIRFCISHEIAHILLLHFKLNSLAFEKEAEMVARRLLMPMCAIKELNIKSAKELADIFKVPIYEARKRYNRYLILKERNMFYSSPLERELKDKLMPYINNIKKS